MDVAKEKPYSEIVPAKILPKPLPQDGFSALLLTITSFVVLLNVEVNITAKRFMDVVKQDTKSSLDTSVTQAIKEAMTEATLKALHYNEVDKSSECIRLIKETLKLYFDALTIVDSHRKEVLTFLLKTAMEQRISEVRSSFQDYSNYSIAVQLSISRLLARQFSSYHIIETHIWDPDTKWTKEFKNFAEYLKNSKGIKTREYTVVVSSDQFKQSENIEILNRIYKLLSSYGFAIYHCELENVRDGTAEEAPAPSIEVYGQDVALFLKPGESYTGGKTIPVKIALLDESPKVKVFIGSVMDHRMPQSTKLVNQQSSTG